MTKYNILEDQISTKVEEPILIYKKPEHQFYDENIYQEWLKKEYYLNYTFFDWENNNPIPYNKEVKFDKEKYWFAKYSSSNTISKQKYHNNENTLAYFPEGVCCLSININSKMTFSGEKRYTSIKSILSNYFFFNHKSWTLCHTQDPKYDNIKDNNTVLFKNVFNAVLALNTHCYTNKIYNPLDESTCQRLTNDIIKGLLSGSLSPSVRCRHSIISPNLKYIRKDRNSKRNIINSEIRKIKNKQRKEIVLDLINKTGNISKKDLINKIAELLVIKYGTAENYFNSVISAIYNKKEPTVVTKVQNCTLSKSENRVQKAIEYYEKKDIKYTQKMVSEKALVSVRTVKTFWKKFDISCKIPTIDSEVHEIEENQNFIYRIPPVEEEQSEEFYKEKYKKHNELIWEFWNSKECIDYEYQKNYINPSPE